MKQFDKYTKRNSELPKARQHLLEQAVEDLRQDPDVLAIYLAGSLAKGNEDNYSDIDLHTIVKPEKLQVFIADKKQRAAKWGDVLFFEGSESAPFIISHFSCFIKIDSWYQSIEEIKPSIWLKGMKILHDPAGILEEIKHASEAFNYKLAAEEVEFWRTKVLAFIHETYRAAMRGEPYYALANLDSVRWLMASGWYMEMGEHLDSPYQVWSKIEGTRSRLNKEQLQLLAEWEAGRTPQSILQALESIAPEFVRLNEALSNQLGIANEDEVVSKAVAVVL